MRVIYAILRTARRRTFGLASLAATLILVATAAGAVLPTGRMIRCQPTGPAIEDLPGATSTDPYRIPTACAYGLTGKTIIPDFTRHIARAETKAGGPPSSAARSRIAPVARAFVAVCPVMLRDKQEVVAPRATFASIYRGERYRFSSAKAKAAFDANPQRYTAVAGGQDLVLASMGADQCLGSLKFARYYQSQLYLFCSKESAQYFDKNPDKFLSRR